MRNKLYFIAPVSDNEAIINTCTVDQVASHWHSIAPDHGNILWVVSKPKATRRAELTAKYKAFPDINDTNAKLTPDIIAAFPASVGLTTEDNTYSAMNKIHSALGMAAMHPLS